LNTLDDREVSKKIRMLVPNYMTTGRGRMIDMASLEMPIPENKIPMLGMHGQFWGHGLRRHRHHRQG